MSSLNRYSDQKGLWFLIILIFSIAVYVFKDFIFLKHLYLFKDIGSDTINLFYPQFIHISDYLRNEGLPKWSFNQGMGQNIFPYSLGIPFNWILYLLGRNYLAYGIIYVELLKIFLGGVIFYFYLRILSRTQYTAIIGGLLFSYSGFMILGGGWYIFSTQAVYGALLLLSFEKYFKNSSWVLFSITIALIGAAMPFHLYLFSVFLLFYIIFRYGDTKGWKMKGFPVFLMKIFGFGLLGIALSSVFLFSNIQEMIESPRITGGASYASSLLSKPIFGFESSDHNVTAVMRFFSNDLLGTGSSYKGWYNYLEAPIFYSGLVSLLLAPQIFIFLDRRRKLIYLILLTLCAIPIIFPFFRYSIWLYAGDYFRGFSLFISIVLLFFSLQALSHIDQSFKINRKLLVGTLFILLGVLLYPYYPEALSIDPNLGNIATVFLISYAGLIYLLGFKRFRNIIQIVLLITVCIELAYFASITVNKRSVMTVKEFKQKVGYNDFTTDAIAYLSSIDKSLYRIEKNYYSSPAIMKGLNDAKVQNYKGTKSYYSFNQKFYIKFLDLSDVIPGNIEGETRWAMGLDQYRPLLLTFASVKYLLSKNNNLTLLGDTYNPISKFGDVIVWKNKNYLPFGFTYKNYIRSSEYKKLSVREKDIALLKAFIVDETNEKILQDFPVYDLKFFSSEYTYKQYGKDIDDRKRDALTITEYNQHIIKGKINLENKELLFFSIPYDQGWSAQVDGQKAKLERVNIGFMGIVLGPGEHTVELEYNPPYLFTGMIVSVMALFLFIFLIWMDYRQRKRETLA